LQEYSAVDDGFPAIKQTPETGLNDYKQSSYIKQRAI